MAARAAVTRGSDAPAPLGQHHELAHVAVDNCGSGGVGAAEVGVTSSHAPDPLDALGIAPAATRACTYAPVSDDGLKHLVARPHELSKPAMT